MVTNDSKYNTFVHYVNFLLFGLLVIVTYLFLVSISLAPKDSFLALRVGYIIIMFLLWGLNYWYQFYKKRKWFMPIIGAILFVGIGMFIGGFVLPYLNYMFYY